MRRPDLGFQAVLSQRAGHARRAIVSIGSVGQMLQLAAPTFGKMAARRLLVAGTMCERAIIEHCVARDGERNMPATGGDAVASGGNTDNRLAHRTDGIAATRSSAIICRPAASAARPCSQTAAQAASNAPAPLPASPRSCRQGHLRYR